MVPYLIAAGVGLVLGVITIAVIHKMNTKVNTVQRSLNKLENKFHECGVNWVGNLLEDLVVGDVAAVYYKLKQFIEQDDITGFFLNELGMPITLYSIRETATYYPELFAKIQAAMDAAVGKVKK